MNSKMDIDLDQPAIVIQLSGDDDSLHLLVDFGAGRGADAPARYGLLSSVDTDDDRYSDDRASLIRTAVRRIDQRVAELRAEARAAA